MRRLLTPLWLILSLLPALAAATPQPLDQIAVIVNDGIILNSQIDDRMADMRYQMTQNKQQVPPPEMLRQQAREQLIIEALQLQLAERNGIKPNDDEVNAALGNMARANNLSLEQFRARVDSTPGVSFAALRAQIGRQQVMEKLRQRHMADRIHITDADVAQFMSTPAGAELNRQLDEQLKPAGAGAAAPAATAAAAKPAAEEYLITQVVVPVEEDASAKQQARLSELAQKLQAAARSGMTPEAAIDSLKGKDDDAAIEPLGWRSYADLPDLLVEPVRNLVAGQPPTLVRSPRGWHLLWLLDRRQPKAPEQLLPTAPPAPTTVVIQREVRHILMRPNALQSSEDVHQAMLAIYKQLQNGADFAEIARLKSQDPGSAVKGGDLGWVSPGDMVPEFDKMIGQTPVGQISEPFQSKYGWHILRVDGERKQDMRDSILKDRARQILYARAYDEELSAWLRELRSEAYVDYRGQQ